MPEIPCARFIIVASVANAMSAIEAPCPMTPIWKIRRSPKSLPIFAPSMTNAATNKE